MAETSEVLIGLVGDVLVSRDNPGEIFREVREILSVPNILFANLECAYTDDPRPVLSAWGTLSARVRNLDAYAEAGFNVMSLANNHILDMGYEAMLQTRARLRAQGIRTCGAGDSLADARQPAIIEVNGVRIAFLAYASVFPMGYEARIDSPGIAPLRAYNFWRDPHPMLHWPGKSPLAATIPDQSDLDNLAQDIRCSRQDADVVAISFHWGDHERVHHLTDHEKRTARYCIDQGADLVVGHHHHTLRGIEWYRGKPIMYGLGHFVFDMHVSWTDAQFENLLSSAGLDPVRYLRRKEWPLLPMHEDARMTLMAWAAANRDGVWDVGFLPCMLTADGLVHPLRQNSAEGAEVVNYLRECIRTQGLNGRIVSEGGPSIGGFETLRVVPA